MNSKNWTGRAAGLLVAVCCVAAAADWRANVGPEAAPDAIAPIDAPFDMPQLERPVFPAAMTDPKGGLLKAQHDPPRRAKLLSIVRAF